MTYDYAPTIEIPIPRFPCGCAMLGGYLVVIVPNCEVHDTPLQLDLPLVIDIA